MLHSTLIFTFFDFLLQLKIAFLLSLFSFSLILQGCELKLNWSKMFMLKILLLLVIFVAVKCDIDTKRSCLDEFRVPKEGFKMKNCIPGHYEGSCLLLFSEPMKFKDALRTCHFDYGGRLATADSEKVFQKWTRKVYRDPDFQVQKDTRFWIGYGDTPFILPTFFGMKPKGELVEPFFDMRYWNKSFDGKTFIYDLPWEDEHDLDKLQEFPCGDYATVFNPNNGNFSIRKVEEKHPFLCETPRYPKFKCSPGWHLNPNNRMCMFFESSAKNFAGAYLGCQSIGGIPVIGSDAEIEVINAVCALYNHGTTNHKIWGGLKLAENKIQSLDGSPVDIENNNNDVNWCTAYYGHIKTGDVVSQSTYCSTKLPFICQRFVDQAFTSKAE